MKVIMNKAPIIPNIEPEAPTVTTFGLPINTTVKLEIRPDIKYKVKNLILPNIFSINAPK